MATLGSLTVDFNANVGNLVAGTNKVRGEMGRTGREAAQMQQRFAASARGMAFAGEQMARAGKLGGEGIRMWVASGAEMVATFGIGGPIVGALAVAGLAIFNLFQNAQKQMEETAAKAREKLLEIMRLTNITQAYADASAVQRQIDARNQEITRLQATDRVMTVSGGTGGRGFTTTVNAAEIARIRKELEPLNEQAAKYSQQISSLANSETSLIRALQIVEDREKAAAVATREHTAAISERQKMLEAARRRQKFVTPPGRENEILSAGTEGAIAGGMPLILQGAKARDRDTAAAAAADRIVREAGRAQRAMEMIAFGFEGAFEGALTRQIRTFREFTLAILGSWQQMLARMFARQASEGLARWIGSAVFGAVSGSLTSVPQVDFPVPQVNTPAPSLAMAGGGGGGSRTIVHAPVHVTIEAIDSRSFSDRLEDHSGVIGRAVAKQVQRSTAMATALRGR